ncbi:glucose-dependent insulinotropic polypeptide [Pelobates cultripes]|uniref:Gastric inhibitory polypeptide n=1 Tax=Pelobates cultripes TaxID=61616 RepID=A0AAD1SHT6_PELCU|nr:glucose-dependent insulinotropic polypeptide [Pelobates cultripes]
MMAPKYLAFLFTFIIFNTVDGEDTKLSESMSSEGPQSMQRRYSEAILASDYSRSVDNMLKKNFVDWLLGRREKKSDNISESAKREADFQYPELHMKDTDFNSELEGGKNFLNWLARNRHGESSSYNEAKTTLCEEVLELLMSTNMCRLRFS